MKKLELLFGLLRVPFDLLAVFAALVLSYQLRVASVDLIPYVQLLDPPVSLPSLAFYIQDFILPSALLFLLVALPLRLYAFQVTRSAWSELGRAVLAALLWLVVVMAWYFLVRKQLFFSRILLLHSTFFLALFVAMSRAVLTVIYRMLLLRGFGIRWVVSIGRLPVPQSVEDVLASDPCYRYLGHVASREILMHRHDKLPIDLVVQTDPDPASDETQSLIEYCRSEQITYAYLPPLFADTPRQLRVERLGLLPMIRFQPTPLDGWGRLFKRAADFLIAVALLILLSPLLLLITILVLFDSGWPVLYVSTRVGDFGRTRIPVLKFRSMVRDADKQKEMLIQSNERGDGPLFKMKDDPRVTRLGRLLRRLSLDELPQLFNVVAGHMSLIGPRPHLPDEVQKYTSYQRRVFAVRPGMTGLAQVSGRAGLSFDEEVRLDLQYIEEWSMFLDLWILWRTFVVVVTKKGAN